MSLQSLFKNPRGSKGLEPSSPTPKPSSPRSTEPHQPGLVGFRHGINAIVKYSNLKGRLAEVKEFHPATYEVVVSGTDFVDVPKYAEISPIGSTIKTELGESVIQRYYPAQDPHDQSYITVYLFREPGNTNIQLGVGIKDRNYIASRLTPLYSDQAIANLMGEPSNVFLYKINMDDIDLTQRIAGINLNELNIPLDQLTLNPEQAAREREFREQREREEREHEQRQQLNQFIDRLMGVDDIVERADTPRYLEPFDVSLVIKANIVKKYYVKKSHFKKQAQQTNQARDPTEILEALDPKIGHYLVRFTRHQHFPLNYINRTNELTNFEKRIKNREDIKLNELIRLGELREFPDNFYPTEINIVRGPFRNQTRPFVKFHPAYLTLSIDNTFIYKHVVPIRRDNNEILMRNDSRIFDSDVFYQDIFLQSIGEQRIEQYVQIKKINQQNNKRLHVFTQAQEQQQPQGEYIIHIYNDAFILNTGTVLIKEQEQVQEEPEQSPVQEQMRQEMQQELEAAIDDEEEMEEGEVDYGEVNDARDVIQDDEQPFQQTFRDLERTQVQTRELTQEERVIETEIQNVLNALNRNPDFNVYNDIDTINNLLNTLARLNLGNEGPLQNVNLRITSNIKYITVCIVLYELLQSQTPLNITNAVDLLVNSYFKNADFQPNALNQNIFINEGNWNNILRRERIRPLQEQVQRTNDNRVKLRIILTNADSIIQSLLRTNLNIHEEIPTFTPELIAVSINPITGKRYRVEREEEALRRVRAPRQLNILSVQNLINRNEPENELPIVWNTRYTTILNNFILNTQTRFSDNRNQQRAFEIIKPFFTKGPYGVNYIDQRLHKFYMTLYRELLAKLSQSYSERIDQQVQQENNSQEQRIQQLIQAARDRSQPRTETTETTETTTETTEDTTPEINPAAELERSHSRRLERMRRTRPESTPRTLISRSQDLLDSDDEGDNEDTD